MVGRGCLEVFVGGGGNSTTVHCHDRCLAQHTHTRARHSKANLVTVVQQQPPAPEGPSDPVTPTTKGRAVYDSGLSYMQGIALYDRMQQLAQCCCVSWISLVYVLLEGPKWELKGAGHHWPRRWALLSEEER